MLCPTCGADVGETIQLCARCEEESRSSISRGENDSSLETLDSTVESEPRELEETEEEEPEFSKFWLWSLVLGTVLIVAVGIIIILINQKAAKTPAGLTNSSGIDYAPSVPRVIQDGGSVTIGNEIVALKSSLALWDAENHVLTIRFFELDADQRNEAHYPVWIRLKPLPLGEELDPERLAECDITIVANERSTTLPCELEQTIEAPKIDYLSGPLSVGSDVSGDFFGAAVLENTRFDGEEGSSSNYKWHLSFNTVLRDYAAYQNSTYLFDKSTLSEALALYVPEEHLIHLAYYPQAVTSDERALIIQQGKMDVSELNRPVLVIHFELAESADSFASGNILNASGAFYHQEGVLFSFDDLSRSGLNVFAHGGMLERSATITGLLERRYHGTVDGSEKEVHIYLPFSAVVLTPDVDTAAISVSGEEPKLDLDSIGHLTVGTEEVRFRAAVGHYYPEINRVEIGFYSSKLAPEELTEIHNKRSFIAAVNGKRANMILSLRFAPGASAASIDSVIEANIYFIRDMLGGFYFPGPAERISISRSREQLKQGGLQRLTGNLRAGEAITGVLLGEEQLSAVGKVFSWRGEFSVVLIALSNSQ